MQLTVLHVLVSLAERRAPAVYRLARKRGVREQMYVGPTCEAVAESYGDDWPTLFRDFEKPDLVCLLEAQTEDGYWLPSAASYAKAELVRLALGTFRDGETLPEFELRGPSEEADDEDEQDDDDDEDEDDDDDDAAAVPQRLPNDVFELDAGAARQPARDYQVELTDALASQIARSTAGTRLLIAVATGGGKTRIANDWIWDHELPRKHKVLWVTKDWSLLRQAAADLCRRRKGALKRLGYCGASGARLMGALAQRVDADVVYTTIHTWRSRKDTDFRDAAFDAVIIDEVHWGEGKGAYRQLYNRYKSRAVFIGLTATPREGSGFALVGQAYGYRKLADLGWLAREIVETPIRTGIAWSPERSTSHGDFDQASLAKLARSAKRNKVIVDTYLKGRTHYGKTLIFACDIAHATALASSLKAAEISATEVHSGMSLDDQRAARDGFTSGQVRVLVNVAMMTHGVDIPDIETVFLARPTASPTLFAQMVGRAVRKTETKEFFRLVDFVDNLRSHSDILVSARDYFGQLGSERDAPRSYRPSPKLRAHAYAKAPFEHVPRDKRHEELVGFDLQPEQTFGVELELTRDGFEKGHQPRDWAKVAKALLAAIPAPKAAAVFADYHNQSKSHDVWNVEWDSTCGWEITSRVLKGHAGFFEIDDVCRAITPVASELGLKVSPRTGTHVHLGWKPELAQLRRLMQLAAHFEPARTSTPMLRVSSSLASMT